MRDKRKLKQIALENIKTLFNEARIQAKKNPELCNNELCNKYVSLARKTAMKVNLRMPREYKRKFCKYCSSYFTSKNYRVRVHKSRIVYYCLNCKRYMRLVIKK